MLFLCPERAFHRSRPHSGKLHHYVVQQLVVRQWQCRIYYHVAEYLVVYVPFSCSISFGQLSPVYIFRDIRATFPSGVKNDLRPCFGLMLFLTRPKFSAISRRGSNFVSCPIRPFRKLNSRAHKKLNSGNAMFGAISGKFRTFDVQINFAIPPIFHFSRWLGEFFSFFQSYEISITLSINSLEKPKNFWTFHDSP